ncbi:hypothetical protein ACJQ6S_000513 [Yersinia enterocolitica]
MMDITKSQEEFEAWFKSEFIVPASSLTLSPETFKNVVQKAYQAGRESIEVELPEMLPDEGYSDGAMFNFCRNDSVKNAPKPSALPVFESRERVNEPDIKASQRIKR